MIAKEPVRCHWCKRKMKYSAVSHSYCCFYCGAQAPCAVSGEEAAYAAAMQRVEPENRVLTLDELRLRCESCKPVYAIRSDGTPMFRGQYTVGIVLDLVPSYGQSEMVIKAIYGQNLSLSQSGYGRSWLAFDRPPTDEERAAVKWEDKE